MTLGVAYDDGEVSAAVARAGKSVFARTEEALSNLLPWRNITTSNQGRCVRSIADDEGIADAADEFDLGGQGPW